MGILFYIHIDTITIMTEDEKKLEELYKKLDEKGVFEKLKKIHESIHASE
jgi:hypothetical protein